MSSWFPLFGRDFLAATSGWTAAERGHYITLLIVQWEQKALLDDLARLELVTPGITECWGVVSEKFPVCGDGKRRNIRLEHERSKSHERSERARQSASRRWAGDPVSGGDQDEPERPPDATAMPTHMRTHMPEQCERICPSNAPMSMSMNGTSSSAHACAWEELWPDLRKAWNAGIGVKWRSSRPSETVKAALAEDGWMPLALQAIEYLPKCLYFQDPVTLNQFCKPGFVDEVLGGKWNNRKRPKGGQPDDEGRRAALDRTAAAFAGAKPAPYRRPHEAAALASTLKLKDEDQ